MNRKCSHCDCTGFQVQTKPNGERVITFKVRHRGEYHTQELNARVLLEIIKPTTDEQAVR